MPSSIDVPLVQPPTMAAAVLFCAAATSGWPSPSDSLLILRALLNARYAILYCSSYG